MTLWDKFFESGRIEDYLCEALISTPTLKSGNRPYSMNIK